MSRAKATSSASGASAAVATEQKINRLAAQLAELKHEIEKLRPGSIVGQCTEAPRETSRAARHESSDDGFIIVEPRMRMKFVRVGNKLIQKHAVVQKHEVVRKPTQKPTRSTKVEKVEAAKPVEKKHPSKPVEKKHIRVLRRGQMCFYGDNCFKSDCKYAHNAQEFGEVIGEENLSYTLPCISANTPGSCKYENCLFAHTPEQLKVKECHFDKNCKNDTCQRYHKSKETIDVYFNRVLVEILAKSRSNGKGRRNLATRSDSKSEKIEVKTDSSTEKIEVKTDPKPEVKTEPSPDSKNRELAYMHQIGSWADATDTEV